ncbi:MAG: hypothetical protein AB7V48_08950 [Sedimentibacter sp.]
MVATPSLIKKITSAGALSSMIFGFVVANVVCIRTTIWNLFSITMYYLSAIVMLVVSRFTKPMDKEKLEPFFRKH